MVQCLTLYGPKKTKDIPESEVYFRPTAYSVIIHDGKVLVAKSRAAQKYNFPGGAIDEGEEIEEGLKREIKEETGIEVEIVKLVRFSEGNYYWNPSNVAANFYVYYFLCKPLTFELLTVDEVEDGDAQAPEWIKIEEINDENLLRAEMGGVEILRSIKR